jgi:hypothetical protein
VKSGVGKLTFEQLIKSWLQGWFWRYLKPLNLGSHKGMVLKKALHPGVPGDLNKTLFYKLLACATLTAVELNLKVASSLTYSLPLSIV